MAAGDRVGHLVEPRLAERERAVVDVETEVLGRLVGHHAPAGDRGVVVVVARLVAPDHVGVAVRFEVVECALHVGPQCAKLGQAAGFDHGVGGDGVVVDEVARRTVPEQAGLPVLLAPQPADPALDLLLIGPGSHRAALAEERQQGQAGHADVVHGVASAATDGAPGRVVVLHEAVAVPPAVFVLMVAEPHQAAVHDGHQRAAASPSAGARAAASVGAAWIAAHADRRVVEFAGERGVGGGWSEAIERMAFCALRGLDVRVLEHRLVDDGLGFDRLGLGFGRWLDRRGSGRQQADLSLGLLGSRRSEARQDEECRGVKDDRDTQPRSSAELFGHRLLGRTARPARWVWRGIRRGCASGREGACSPTLG